MGKGFDCATPLTASLAAKFYADGYRFVCRYLAPPGSGKRLTAAEAKICTDAGLYLVSVFERTADRALGGAANGAEDGAMALQYAREIGQPEGTPIYAAIDFDATAANYAAIEAYLRAFDAQITGYECAVYGEYEVCKAMLDRGVVSRVWQTYAWSRGAKLAAPELYQYQNDITVNGIDIDLDESNGDAGGWMVGMAIKQNKLDEDLANTAIAFVAKDYDANEELYEKHVASGDTEGAEACLNQMNYAHDVANRLRAAAGLPLE